jgi:hypothetical protein
MPTGSIEGLDAEPSLGELDEGGEVLGVPEPVADGGATGSPLHAVASTTSAVAQIARRISGSLSMSA